MAYKRYFVKASWASGTEGRRDHQNTVASLDLAEDYYTMINELHVDMFGIKTHQRANFTIDFMIETGGVL